MKTLTISKIAAQVRDNIILTEQKADRQLEDLRQEALRKLLYEFESAFKDQIPMLEEAGIKYSVHFNSLYDHEGSYVSFKLRHLYTAEVKELKMDFISGVSYRYEYTGINGADIARSVYGEWNRDAFCLFIDDNLLSDFEGQTLEEEILLKKFLPADKNDDDAQFLTISELLNEFLSEADVRNLTVGKLGRALAKHGFIKWQKGELRLSGYSVKRLS